jgi:hypothetical protein
MLDDAAPASGATFAQAAGDLAPRHRAPTAVAQRVDQETTGSATPIA